jgi:hypothetical protein
MRARWVCDAQPQQAPDFLTSPDRLDVEAPTPYRSAA